MTLIVADAQQIAQLELDEYLWQQSQEMADAAVRHPEELLWVNEVLRSQAESLSPSLTN